MRVRSRRPFAGFPSRLYFSKSSLALEEFSRASARPIGLCLLRDGDMMSVRGAPFLIGTTMLLLIWLLVLCLCRVQLGAVLVTRDLLVNELSVWLTLW